MTPLDVIHQLNALPPTTTLLQRLDLYTKAINLLYQFTLTKPQTIKRKRRPRGERPEYLAKSGHYCQSCSKDDYDMTTILICSNCLERIKPVHQWE